MEPSLTTIHSFKQESGPLEVKRSLTAAGDSWGSDWTRHTLSICWVEKVHVALYVHLPEAIEMLTPLDIVGDQNPGNTGRDDP